MLAEQRSDPARTGASVAGARWLELAAAALLATVLMAPRAAQAVVAILAILLVTVSLRQQDWQWPRLRDAPALVLALGTFGVYIAFNAFLAVDKLEAFGKVLYFWVLLLCGFLASRAIGGIDSDGLRRIGRGAMIGIAIAAALLMVEVIFDQPLKTLLFKLVPGARIAPKHLQTMQGELVGINSYVLNRNVGVLSLALWPALLLMRSYLARGAMVAASVALAIVTTFAVFQSEHETSMLALIFSGIAFAGMVYAAPVMRKLILAGWLVATLLVVPIAMLAYSAGLHQASSIPQTGRNRIILWNVTAYEVMNQPILGIGVASTKELDEKAASTAKQPEGHGYPLRTGRHAHNVFMQTWYELGAIGALLLAAIGALLLRWIGALPTMASAYGHAAFVAAVLVGAFSWGMWQTWFMAAYGIWALLLLLAVTILSRSHQS